MVKNVISFFIRLLGVDPKTVESTAVWPDLAIFLDFGQLFKAFGNIQFSQISYILRQIL